MEKLDTVLFYYIEKSIKTYRQFAQRELRKAGLKITVDQWLTLNCINEHPHLTQTELAEAIFKDTASVTRIIELLVQANYLQRTVNEDDRRKSILNISSYGRDIINKASPVVDNYRSQALKGIGLSKEKHVKMVLKSIIQNCQ